MIIVYNISNFSPNLTSNIVDILRLSTNLTFLELLGKVESSY